VTKLENGREPSWLELDGALERACGVLPASLRCLRGADDLVSDRGVWLLFGELLGSGQCRLRVALVDGVQRPL
jgi:hypothetical protein